MRRLFLRLICVALICGLGAGGTTSLGAPLSEVTLPIDDPRCLAHLTHWKYERDLIEGQSIAVKDGQVYLKNNRYTLFEASYDSELSTIVYHHKDGRVPEKINFGEKGELAPQLHLAVVHGGGGMKSQGGSWLNFMNLMMSSKSKKGSMAGQLKGLDHWLPVVAESIDLPGYGAGPKLDKYKSATDKMNYLIKWFESMKKASGLPLVVLARSASTGFLPAIAHARPDLLAGVILIGPMHPTVGMGENKRLGIEHAMKNGEFRVSTDEERLRWIRKNLEAGVLISPMIGTELKSNIIYIDELIRLAGGFPATGTGERYRFVRELQIRGLLPDGNPEEILPKLGHIPGGTVEQRQRWVRKKIAQDEFIPNLEGLHTLFGWYDQIGRADSLPLNWHRSRNPFNGVPTLVLVGESDWQVPSRVRWAYRYHVQRAQEKQALTRYRSYKEVGHDVVAVAHRHLRNEGKEKVFDIYSEVLLFLSQVQARQAGK